MDGMAAGLIKREDIDAVRERARIDELASDYVTLRTAGVGSMKGLCPFHDEKTPSFHVRPHLGQWHCFGCGEGGDVISFVQRIGSLPFTDAVEMLAGRYGVTLRYEESSGRGGGERRSSAPMRQRLVEAHQIAEQFYREQLSTPLAGIGRQFLAERGFTQEQAENFGIGFAPEGWDNLLKLLRGRGFTEPELKASGLVSEGQRGVYDRFRGRLMWPIREITGRTIGFGARKLRDDDPGPKYLNTPETEIYKKSQVLYGIDLARKDIAGKHEVVVVEGYTDVMACHIAGITTAVATCGTAFGDDHARIVRRLMGDTNRASGLRLSTGAGLGGQVIFTFDGDAAGQQAAMRAFDDDQRFVAQTYVSVEPSGMDPCDLRLSRGDGALTALIENRRPLFEFAIRSTLAQVDLDTAEGQIGGLRASAPVVAQIRDRALRPEYARRLSGWLGLPERQVLQAVQDASRVAVAAPKQIDSQPNTGGGPGGAAPGAPGAGAGGPAPDLGPEDESGRLGSTYSLRDVANPRDPVATVEVEALSVVLQAPATADQALLDMLPAQAFHIPALQAVWEAIRIAGGPAAVRDSGTSPVVWLDQVRESTPEMLRGIVGELLSRPLAAQSESHVPALSASLLKSLLELSLNREYSALQGRLSRADATSDPEGYKALMTEMVALQSQRRALHAGER